jgi:pyruvate carboxylase subunit B
MVHLEAIPGTPLRQLQLDQESHAVVLERTAEGAWLIGIEGIRYEVLVVDERTRHIQSLTRLDGRRSGSLALRAPMPGLVVRVLAQSGQRVVPGQALVVLEAMKMENELRAGAAAMVQEVLVVPGQAVEKGQLLIGFSDALP